MFIIGGALGFIFFVVAFGLYASALEWQANSYAFLALAGFFGIASLVLGLVQFEIRYRWAIADQLAARQSSVEAVAAEIEDRADTAATGAEFATFWRDTYTRLNSYHADAERQLRSSYLLAQLAAALGFVTLLSLGFVAAFVDNTVQTIVAGAAATVGAGLAAFISKTFQTTYAQALHQRMTYFDEPVVMARFLAAERLVQQLEQGSARSEALLTIVRAAASEPGANATSSASSPSAATVDA